MRTEYIKDVLEAIHSVQQRADKALNVNNRDLYIKLILDLAALEACLRIEAEKLIDKAS